MYKNNDPSQPWNDPCYSNDPLAPHNDPIYSNDPTKPWNNPAGSYEELNNYERNKYGMRSNTYNSDY